MKKANLRGVRPIIKNHPVMGRLLTLVLLPVALLAWPIVGMREVWPDLRAELADMISVIFLPWEGDK